MYELKKNGKLFTSKFVGTGPSSYKKRIYRAAVSQRLRNTALEQAIMAQRASRSMYSSTLSLTLAPHVGGWSTPRPWRFTPGKFTRYPLHRRLGGPQAWSARVQKILAPPGFDPRTVQPVASRETDYDILAHGSLGGFG